MYENDFLLAVRACGLVAVADVHAPHILSVVPDVFVADYKDTVFITGDSSAYKVNEFGIYSLITQPKELIRRILKDELFLFLVSISISASACCQCTTMPPCCQL